MINKLKNEFQHDQNQSDHQFTLKEFKKFCAFKLKMCYINLSIIIQDLTVLFLWQNFSACVF